MRKAHTRTAESTRRWEGHGIARCMDENVPDVGMLQGGKELVLIKKQ